MVVAALLAAASCERGSAPRAGSSGGADAGQAPGPRATTAGATATLTCGSARCPSSAMFAACCVDAARGTCGVENRVVGVACGVPAIADPTCPPVSIDFAGTAFTAQGCCAPSGVCGGFNLGSPCAVVSARNEDDAGAVEPRTCRPR